MTFQKQLSLFVLPVLGIALLCYATAPHRVGVSPDTMAFLNVAHHIQAGEGISAYYPLYSDRSQPLAAWPPLFSFVIWSGMPFGIHPLDTVWVVNLALFGLNLLLAGWIVARSCRSAAAGWIAQAFFILYSPWRGTFAWGLSEPLFLLFIHTALLFLLKYFESARGRDWQMAALALGFSEITRYIGGIYIPVFALAIFLYDKGRAAERFRTATRFFILGSVIPMVWAVRNYFRLSYLGTESRSWADRVFGSLMHREEQFNSLCHNARSSMDAYAAWLGDILGYTVVSEMNLWPLSAMILIGAAVIGARLFGKESGSRAHLAAAALGLLAFCYTAGLIAALTFACFDAETPPRYLLPTATHLSMLLIILVFSSARRNFRHAMGLVFAFWMAYSTTGLIHWVDHTRQKGADDTRGSRWIEAKERSWFPTPELIQDFHRRKQRERQSIGASY